MAVVQPDFYRHDNLVRKSIQIPSTQHKELKALAVELDSSLGDVVETIMDLMRQDNYEQLKAAIIQKREQSFSSLGHSLDEACVFNCFWEGTEIGVGFIKGVTEGGE